MKNWKQIIVAVAMLFAFSAITVTPLIGCKSTPQKIAINSLATLGTGVNSAYEGYLESVVTGQTPTNDVPKVTGLYRNFQTAFGVAAGAAHFATNTTLATPELIAIANKVTDAITTIKGGH